MGLGIVDGINIGEFERRVYFPTNFETVVSNILITMFEEESFDNYT